MFISALKDIFKDSLTQTITFSLKIQDQLVQLFIEEKKAQKRGIGKLHENTQSIEYAQEEHILT